MEQPATNLTEIAADYVRIFDANSKRWTDVRDALSRRGKSRTPVSIPVADEVETFLTYPNATSNQVPALDGMLAYIAQQKIGAGNVTNRYVTVRRKNLFTIEGDTHVTQKAVTLQVVKRPVFMDIFAPTFVMKKILNQKVVRPTIIYYENAVPM